MQDYGGDGGVHDAPHVAHDAPIAAKSAPRPPVPAMTLLSFAALATGLVIAFSFRAG